MQTRSVTRKLADALATSTHVSNDSSAENTACRRSKIASNDKNNKSKVKSKDNTITPRKMGVELKKRRSQRLMTDEEKNSQNDEKVAEETSSVSLDEPQEKIKKDSPSLSTSKKRKSVKKAKEVQEEVMEMKVKEEVKPKVTNSDRTDLGSPPKRKKIKTDVDDTAENAGSKEKLATDSSFTNEVKISTIKKVESVDTSSSYDKELTKDEDRSEAEEISVSPKLDPEIPYCINKEEEVDEYEPTQETQNNDAEELAEEESAVEEIIKNVKAVEVKENEISSPSDEREKNGGAPKETALKGLDIKIEKLPQDFLNSVSERKLVIGGSRTEQKKDMKKQMKGSFKKKTLDEKNYIPLNTNGATRFFVADVKNLQKGGLCHPAVNVKRDLMYGNRIRRVPYSTVLAYNMKQMSRNLRF